MYFGTPSNCDNISDLNIGINEVLGDDQQLYNVYREYQERASNYLRVHHNQNIDLLPPNYGHIHNVIKNYHYFSDHNGRHFFHNEDNPYIRDYHRGNDDSRASDEFNRQTTIYSLSWLVVNIRCNTFQNNNTLVTNTLGNRIGGRKTRNKNKKPKKSRGSKKTNRRRIK
jgi:hypothetical protein